jgi:dUTP pyrophosphatase
VIATGLAVEIPAGYAGLVLPRSGLAARHGITLLNAPGLIDSGYRGEVLVVFHNTDANDTFVVEPGMRIAQLVVIAVPELRLVEQVELAHSERGERGFGSSRV